MTGKKMQHCVDYACVNRDERTTLRFRFLPCKHEQSIKTQTNDKERNNSPFSFFFH